MRLGRAESDRADRDSKPTAKRAMRSRCTPRVCRLDHGGTMWRIGTFVAYDRM